MGRTLTGAIFLFLCGVSAFARPEPRPALATRFAEGPDAVRAVLDATGDDRETETGLKMFPEKESK